MVNVNNIKTVELPVIRYAMMLLWGHPNSSLGYVLFVWMIICCVMPEVVISMEMMLHGEQMALSR